MVGGCGGVLVLRPPLGVELVIGALLSEVRTGGVGLEPLGRGFCAGQGQLGLVLGLRPLGRSYNAC